jgi:nicotinamidase-related amidase
MKTGIFTFILFLVSTTSMYAQDVGPALIIIDWQNGFDDQARFGGNRNNPDAEKNTRKLLDAWRMQKLPIIYVKHNNLKNPNSVFAPGQPGNEIKDIVKPLEGEPVIVKNVHSAFIGTDLKRRLDSLQIKAVVITGIQTDKCVSTTARMAGDYQFKVYVVSDATATFDAKTPSGKKIPSEVIHEANLATLHNEFATVMTANEVLLTFFKK